MELFLHVLLLIKSIVQAQNGPRKPLVVLAGCQTVCKHVMFASVLSKGQCVRGTSSLPFTHLYICRSLRAVATELQGKQPNYVDETNRQPTRAMDHRYGCTLTRGKSRINQHEADVGIALTQLQERVGLWYGKKFKWYESRSLGVISTRYCRNFCTAPVYAPIKRLPHRAGRATTIASSGLRQPQQRLRD
jgi:hypothetical protein